MRTLTFTLLAAASLALPVCAQPNWPQFRGPNGLGVAPQGNPPIHFGASTNLLWKTALPAGHSSPCIWGDRIFLTSLEKEQLETLCFDRRTGRLLWRRPAPAEKIEPTHRLGNPAASTPATDGHRVYVHFGSFGMLCYDFDGKEQWRKPLPFPVIEYGSSASPILAGDLAVIVCDQDIHSYLLALDKATGRIAWKVERPEFPRGFGTPLLWRHDAIEEIVVPGTLWLKSYDVKDGNERWKVRGLARVFCTSPVAGDGLLFVAAWAPGGDAASRITMPAFEQFAGENDKNKDGKFTKDEVPPGPFLERFSQIDANKDQVITPGEWTSMADIFARVENCAVAVRPGGRGDITDTHVVWKQTRGLPYVPSPLLYEGRFYLVKNGGLASCFDAKTGKPFYLEERLGALGDYYASPVAAGGRIYSASQNGVVVVFKAGETLDVLARNELGEIVMATPAIIDGDLYMRTAGHLYAFGAGEKI